MRASGLMRVSFLKCSNYLMFLLLSLLRKGLVSLRWSEDRDVENSSNLCCFCEAPLGLGPTLTGELSLAEALGCGLLGIIGCTISQSD